jgi:hypothetical protein
MDEEGLYTCVLRVKSKYMSTEKQVHIRKIPFKNVVWNSFLPDEEPWHLSNA